VLPVNLPTMPLLTSLNISTENSPTWLPGTHAFTTDQSHYSKSVLNLFPWLSKWHYLHLLLSTARATIDRYLLQVPSGCSAANLLAAAAAVDRWDRQRDKVNTQTVA